MTAMTATSQPCESTTSVASRLGHATRRASACAPISPASRASSGARCCATCTSASASSRRWCGPLVWLFIFAAGFRQTLGVSIIPPYETYVLYEVYVMPGLIGMIQLFNAHAVLAVDGLRPRDGRHAHAAGQPVPALVPAALQADRRRRRLDRCRSTCSCSSPISGRSSRRRWGYLTVLPALILSGPDARRASACSCPR